MIGVEPALGLPFLAGVAAPEACRERAGELRVGLVRLAIGAIVELRYHVSLDLSLDLALRPQRPDRAALIGRDRMVLALDDERHQPAEALHMELAGAVPLPFHQRRRARAQSEAGQRPGSGDGLQ